MSGRSKVSVPPRSRLEDGSAQVNGFGVGRGAVLSPRAWKQSRTYGDFPDFGGPPNSSIVCSVLS